MFLVIFTALGAPTKGLNPPRTACPSSTSRPTNLLGFRLSGFEIMAFMYKPGGSLYFLDFER